MPRNFMLFSLVQHLQNIVTPQSGKSLFTSCLGECFKVFNCSRRAYSYSLSTLLPTSHPRIGTSSCTRILFYFPYFLRGSDLNSISKNFTLQCLSHCVSSVTFLSPVYLGAPGQLTRYRFFLSISTSLHRPNGQCPWKEVK